jgi:hypothetical protein
MDNLRKWHVIIVGKYNMCKRNGEFHCEVPYAIWKVFFNRFRLSWVMPRRVVDFYACW